VTAITAAIASRKRGGQGDAVIRNCWGQVVPGASDVQIPSEAKAPENARDLDRAPAGWAWRTSS
jgi:hypothetical protein